VSLGSYFDGCRIERGAVAIKKKFFVHVGKENEGSPLKRSMKWPKKRRG